MIELIHLKKQFSKTMAVDDLNMIIDSGKITAFLGPNGAGKTTTIKMMTGLLKPTGGMIKINGRNIEEDSLTYKKSMAYIPDFPFLYERLTGREYLEFVAGVHEISKKESLDRIHEMIHVFMLEDVENSLIKTYSHGMKQRLVFCSALIKVPEILIVDEPMVGLDPKTARIIKDRIRMIAKGGGLVFLSTHQLHVAYELADEIIIIHKGKIRLRGDPKHLVADSNEVNLEDLFLKITS